MTSCTLVIDTREKNVTRHAVELAGITHVIKQITVGDYAVISPAGQMLVTIERKSFNDFAASLKDGRHGNKAKLMDMRAATGCRIIYIIEGEEPTNPRELIGGIAYSSIESSIFHMMIRDCISIIRTTDTVATARTLARFVRSMDTLYNKHGYIADMLFCKLDPQNEEVPATTSTTMDALARKCVKSDHEIARELWSCFPGISMESADEYIKHWSVADIVMHRIPRTSIMTFKTATGRAISKRVVDGLTSIGRTLEIRLIAVIPGISRQSATVLANDTPLTQLLACKVDELAAQCINKTNGRELGRKLASNLLKYFNYRYDPTPASTPTPSPAPIPAPPSIPTPTPITDYPPALRSPVPSSTMITNDTSITGSIDSANTSNVHNTVIPHDITPGAQTS